MTDNNFQTPPLPPSAPNFQPAQPSPVEIRTEQTSEPAISRVADEDFATRFKLSPNIYKTKTMSAILGGTLLAGLLLGMIFFGGSSSAPPQGPSGLQGVVRNPDIRESLQRCGIVSETEPCVVYIVNHSRADRYAEYFFEQAVKLTGRQPYLVAIENPQYAKMRIPPGYITQIKIPRLQ